MDQSRDQSESGLSVVEHADDLTILCERFDQEWSSAEAASIESWLEMVPPEKRGLLLSRLLGIELAHRTLLGETPHPREYAGRFPEYQEFVESQFRWLMTATHVDSHTGTKSSTAIFGKIAHAINPESRREPGHVVGRYQLQELVGCGGFGEVWRAHDPQLSRTVAIKLLRPDRKFPDDMFENLRAEARRVASLTHRNIVPVYDIAEDDGGVYIVSEFIPGKTLTDRMLRARPTIAESVAIAVQIADALHHAHLAGFIHRDVKPSNILLRENGEAVLADFGLATSEADQLHEDGGAMGTWKYMSPEQARGDSNRCDARTDVYSLGVLLFELLTGRLPYVGEEPQAYIEQILSGEPQRPRTINDEIPPELERLCLQCLSKSADERFTTCAELAEALRRFQLTHTVGGANSSAPPLSGPMPQAASLVDMPRRRRPTGLAAGFVGVAALLAVAMSLGLRERPVSQLSSRSETEVGNGGGGRLPPIPIDTEWRSLLRNEPLMISWPHAPGREKPWFDSQLQSYRVRSDYSEWIATTGKMNGAAFEMRAVIELQDWVGMAALVWACEDDNASFPEKRRQCLTAEFSHWTKDLPALLRIRRHELQHVAFDELQIVDSSTVDDLEVQLPTKVTAPLLVRVTETGVTVEFDGVPWQPVDSGNEVTWFPKGAAHFGIMGSGRQTSFVNLELRNVR